MAAANEQLVDWMRTGKFELGVLAEIDWKKFDPTKASQAEVDEIEAPIRTFFSHLTKSEFLAGAHKREMLGYPVSTVADIAQDPQLEARGFWQMVSGPDGIVRRHAGSFAVIDGKRPKLTAYALEKPARKKAVAEERR
jgi:crotonobetainyl-CoA:carnitine CoA-transferase CaiB-like acyl-CoA transferase